MTEVSFNNSEFAMFCCCLDDIVEIYFTRMNFTRSQWGMIAKRLSKMEVKTEKLTLDLGIDDKECISPLCSLHGFKMIEKGKTIVFERK